MKKLLMITTGIFFLFSSCKNTVKEETTTETTTEVTASAETFSPFYIMIAKAKVKDFAQFKSMYDSKDSLRNAYGISKFVLSKGMHDANMVYVTEKISDLQKAKDFSTSAAVKKASQDGGTVGAPVFSFIKIVRMDETPAEFKDRIMMMHKVKDFDAWLKAYDAEGKEARAQYGLLDRALGRGADDSNMVYIVFTVADMKKASTRENSPELKKIMEDAGVIGKPTSYMYTVEEMYK